MIISTSSGGESQKQWKYTALHFMWSSLGQIIWSADNPKEEKLTFGSIFTSNKRCLCVHVLWVNEHVCMHVWTD